MMIFFPVWVICQYSTFCFLNKKTLNLYQGVWIVKQNEKILQFPISVDGILF